MNNNNTTANDSKYSDVVTALETQGRVISAIILRETKSRYGEHRLGFFWVLLEPTLMILGFTLIRSLLGAGISHGMEPELYMLTGIAPFLLFRGVMSNTSAAISANKALLGFPQVTTFDLIMARALLEFGTIVCVFFILLMGLLLFGFDIDIERPLPLFGAFSLMFAAGLGAGLILCSVSPFFPSIKQLSGQILGRPLFFTSGIFFTVGDLPASARDYLLYNPLLHVTELSRSAFFKSFESSYIDLEYALMFCLWLLAFGLMMHQALHKRALGT